MRKTPQRDYCVIEVLGVEYFVDWEHLRLGGSFFLPTTATDTMVRNILKDYERKLDMRLVAHNRSEYGRYGVRVWRLG